ncbi:MAG: hypothetical protein KAI03_06090 [Candidatus Aureabacteria bacterium]|nr:hypothetical protein [Candidatus Auribacterota bacterium]
MRTSKQKFYKSKEGMALIVTLLILMVLSVMAVTFSTTMSIEAKLANNYRYELETELLTRSALEYAVEILRYDLLEDMADAADTTSAPYTLFDYHTEDWVEAFAGGDVNLNSDSIEDSKWINIESPWGDREGLIGRFAIYISDEASKVNLNVAGTGNQNQGWSTNEIDMRLVPSMPGKETDVYNYKLGAGNLPGLSATDDNYSNDILMNDFVDNDADGSVDEANEGIDDPREYIFESPQGNDTRWVAIEQLQQISGVGAATIDDWKKDATLWSWDHDISSYRNPGSGNWWRDNWLPKTNLNHITSWQDMYRPFINPEETSDSTDSGTIPNWQQKFLNMVDYFDTDCIPTEIEFGGVKYAGCEGLVINEVLTMPYQMIEMGEAACRVYETSHFPSGGVNGWLGDIASGGKTNWGNEVFHEYERTSTGVPRDWPFTPDIKRPGYYEVRVTYRGWINSDVGGPGIPSEPKFTLMLSNSKGSPAKSEEIEATVHDTFDTWSSLDDQTPSEVWWFDGGGNDTITLRFVTDPLSDGIRVDNIEIDQKGHTNYVELWNCSKQDIPLKGLRLVVLQGYYGWYPFDTYMGVDAMIYSNEYMVFTTRMDNIGGSGEDLISFASSYGDQDGIWEYDESNFGADGKPGGGDDTGIVHAQENYRVRDLDTASWSWNCYWDETHDDGAVILEEATHLLTKLSFDAYDLDNTVDPPDDQGYLQNCSQERESPIVSWIEGGCGDVGTLALWNNAYQLCLGSGGVYSSPGRVNYSDIFGGTEAILDEPAVSAGMLRDMYVDSTAKFSTADLKEIAHRFTNNCIVIAAEQWSSHTGANWTWDADDDPNGLGCFKSTSNGRTSWASAYDEFTFTNGTKGVYVPDGFYYIVLYGKYKNDEDFQGGGVNEDERNDFRMHVDDYLSPGYVVGSPARCEIRPDHGAWFPEIDPAQPGYPVHIGDGELRFRLAAYWDNADGGGNENESYFDYLVLIPKAVNNPAAAGSTMPLSGRVPGRININTASEVVLQSLPGIDATIAGEIWTYVNTIQPFQKIGDVIEDPLSGLPDTDVTPEIFEKIANLITVRSDIFEVIIQAERIIDKNKDSAFNAGDKIVAKKKMRAIVDRSTTPATVILMKEEEID